MPLRPFSPNTANESTYINEEYLDNQDYVALPSSNQIARRVVLFDVNGNPVATTSLTPSSPTFATVGTSSASAVAANASRRGLVLTNTSANRISFGLGATAVINRGITLIPFGVWVMEQYEFTTGAINAVASAASSNLCIQEFTW